MSKMQYKRLRIQSINDLSYFNDIKFMEPVIRFGKEKQDNNMYDDWDEYHHTKNLLTKLKLRLDKEQDFKIDLYYIEYEKNIIAICFIIYGSQYMKECFFPYEENNELSSSVQLTCFHIVKEYRGIGTKWLKKVIFPDLSKNNIKAVYIKSSHNRALYLYQKLGTCVGNYTGISDHQLYQRLGYIYRVNI